MKLLLCFTHDDGFQLHSYALCNGLLFDWPFNTSLWLLLASLKDASCILLSSPSSFFLSYLIFVSPSFLLCFIVAHANLSTCECLSPLLALVLLSSPSIECKFIAVSFKLTTQWQEWSSWISNCKVQLATWIVIGSLIVQVLCREEEKKCTMNTQRNSVRCQLICLLLARSLLPILHSSSILLSLTYLSTSSSLLMEITNSCCILPIFTSTVHFCHLPCVWVWVSPLLSPSSSSAYNEATFDTNDT